VKTDINEAPWEALADPTRRALLERLRREGPLAAGELAAGFAISRPAVSQHLAVLRAASLVRVRPEGTKRVYSLDPSGLTALRAFVEGLWTTVLADFADEVRRSATSDTPDQHVPTRKATP
jgi:DNA-binding transcriptional ArsR family regulator